MSWVDSRTIAAAAGINERRVRKALAKIVAGRATQWRGCRLEIKVAHARGGASGKSYLVKASSLPPYLQERLKARQTPVESRSNGGFQGEAGQHLWWLDYLAPALQHKANTPERAEALAQLDGKPTRDWRGRAFAPSLRTLQRHVKRCDDGRKSGRHSRKDKGMKRFFISRKWDKAVPFADDIKAKVAEDLKQEIRGLLKSGASWGHTLLLARKFLIDTTRSWGFRPSDPAVLERVCFIPKQIVSAELIYRNVHQFKRDRKAYEDRRPRIRRGIDGMRPMELVVGDVHPVDIHLTRDDGTIGTARLIAFMDWATQRVWCELIFFEKRGGVRNPDVIEVFAAMAEHPAWGLPENLYIDNGKEYGFAAFLDDAMRLTVPGFHGPARTVQMLNKLPDSVTKAMPYNASAKPIERWFGDFEKRYLSTLPGWIGGNRMNKKQEAIGRTVAPFGTFEEFVPAFFGLLKTYHHVAQGKQSQLKGLSPEAAFKKYVDGGWAATVMSRDEVRAACARTEERKVDQGAIQLGGRIWTCPELQAYQHEKVWVRVPAYHTPAELLLLDRHGERVGIATPDVEFHPLDTRGAKTSAERAKAHRKAVRALDRAVPDTNVAGRLIALGQAHPDTIPNEPIGTVSYDPAKRPARVATPRKPSTQQERLREEAEIREAQLALVNQMRAASR